MLSPRKQEILNIIIKYYLQYGEPISSKFIAGEIGVSSATVRNEMAELTEKGFLEQPHTSAGRIPSSSAFRSYINNKYDSFFIENERKSFFDSTLATCDPEELLNQAAISLSGDYACIVSTLGDQNTKIKAVQFVQISRKSALLILLTSVGTTKSKIFTCEFALNQDMLRIFFRAFNEQLMGLKLSDITTTFLQKFALSQGDLSILMASAIVALYEAVIDTAKAEIIIKGQTNLFLQNAFNSENFMAFSELLNKPELLRTSLIERPTRMSVIIGGETIFPQLNDSSIVSSKYYVNGVECGVFAVVGPVRMNYPKVITELRYVSDYVGNALTAFINEET